MKRVLLFVLTNFAILIVLWFSRQREFRADSGDRKAEGLRRLFMSHPPIEERVAALQAAQ